MATFRSQVVERLRMLGWTVVLLALSGATFALLLATVLLVPGIALWVGIPGFVGIAWLTRRVTEAHRWIFASVLDVKVDRPYRRWPSGHLGRRLVDLMRDPATWRDVAWLAVNCTVGLAVYLLVITMIGLSLWYLAMPLLWQVAPGEWLRTDFGFWAIDRPARAWVSTPIALLLLTLWWLTPHHLRGYARLSRLLLGPTTSAGMADRVRELTESRAETVDTQAAELRRIERDLHDGAQARLVSLGMTLGLAEELLRIDTDAAARLLAEARENSDQALGELRRLVRGMHPPVLADRGLPGAVQALALAHPLPVDVADQLTGRPPAPVESAVYFAIAETLTNVSKHALATRIQVRLRHDDGRLVVTVSDDGTGGAVTQVGGGIHGAARRLSAFDGTLHVASPAGGPTVVTLEIPCELSSPKTTPSSGTG